MTIAVYLDTHHISRIASNQSAISRYFADPEVSFVFSASHIIESLPKDPRENPAAITRLKIIMGPHAKSVVGWGKVAEIEKLNRAVLSDFACDKDSMLFEDFVISRQKWVKNARESLKAILRQQFPNPLVRRPIQAKLLKLGKMTPAAFQLIRDQLPRTSAQTAEEMPQALPLLTDGGLYDFLEGNVSEGVFRKNFMASLANPVALAEMSSAPDLASIIDLSRFFWSQSDELTALVAKFVADVRNDFAKPGAPNYTKGREQIETHLSSNDFRNALVQRFTGVAVSADDLTRMPGARLFVDVFAQYILEKLDQYSNSASNDFGIEPKFKRSDAADFSHVFYYPYVDLFGCDGAMANRIRKAGWPVEKIVTTDGDLESKLRVARHDTTLTAS